MGRDSDFKDFPIKEGLESNLGHFWEPKSYFNMFFFFLLMGRSCMEILELRHLELDGNLRSISQWFAAMIIEKRAQAGRNDREISQFTKQQIQRWGHSGLIILAAEWHHQRGTDCLLPIVWASSQHHQGHGVTNLPIQIQEKRAKLLFQCSQWPFSPVWRADLDCVSQSLAECVHWLVGWEVRLCSWGWGWGWISTGFMDSHGKDGLWSRIC